MKKNSVVSKLHESIIDHMEKKGIWEESLRDELPTSWENYNGYILFSLPYFKSERWFEGGTDLWEVICTCLRSHSIAIKDRIRNDPFRSPQAHIVYGNSPVVIYTDNKIKYSWNVEKTMFCAGNVTERHRIGSLKCENEVVADLFAGIGYFTLPYLVHAKAQFVHACEWNPIAVECLRRNLHLNNVENKCRIYEGDNRKVCPKNIANSVNLGLIPSSEEYWDVACEALLSSGGILYVHQNVTSQISSIRPSCETCTVILKRIFDRLNLVVTKNMIIPRVIIFREEDLNFNLDIESSVKWKYLEWFIFSLHISHVVLSILQKINNFQWFVSVEEVFKVKSYAPHIDHLVYTVTCKT